MLYVGEDVETRSLARIRRRAFLRIPTSVFPVLRDSDKAIVRIDLISVLKGLIYPTSRHKREVSKAVAVGIVVVK